MKARLAAELEAKNQLLYFMSHDLAEPLRHARAFTDMAREASKDPQSLALLGKAVSALERTQRLLDSLNEYRKLTNLGRNGSVDVASVIQEAIGSLAGFAETGATVEHGQLPTITVNRFALLTVFRNMIGNSIKYRGTSAPVIHVSVVLEGDSWHFTLEDNGIGFDEEHAQAVFRLGERLHPPGARQGDGIGLANVLAALESQGGRAWAEGRPGVGSRFHFALPVTPPDSSG